MSWKEDFQTEYIEMPVEEGIVLRRTERGTTATNVPSLVVVHSPSGFEWGYGGSGPADLALNLCELALRKLGYEGEKVDGWDGRGECFRKAWHLHQDLKREFVAGLPQEGGEFRWSQVLKWVEAHI